MHNKPYVGRIALCTRKKLLKSGEIRHFYGTRGLRGDNKAITRELRGDYKGTPRRLPGDY